LSGDELPAVTVPPCLNTGFSLASASRELSARTDSSRVNSSTSHFFTGTGTGAISAANSPAAHAAAARRCDTSAKASCSSRLMPHFAAMFSAVSPIDCSSKRAAIRGFG
jgi:hypothetical protein